MTTYGLLIFDGAEELDVAGPWDVRRSIQYEPAPPYLAHEPGGT
jgi:hypothetical protein